MSSDNETRMSGDTGEQPFVPAPKKPPHPTFVSGKEILALPMLQPNDAEVDNIRGYLVKLLLTLWAKQEGFSGKRPFGNSGWYHDLYKPLIAANLIDGEFDEDGFIQSCDDVKAEQLIKLAINAL